ncbi:putative membrane protein [Helicobacter pylori Hp H-10]|nr:putative membrane protein [Helicobacter pylori Hp H-10]
MESRHLIINYRYAHSIGAATNISMSHVMFLIFFDESS